jgi:hypothetical protein
MPDSAEKPTPTLKIDEVALSSEKVPRAVLPWAAELVDGRLS